MSLELDYREEELTDYTAFRCIVTLIPYCNCVLVVTPGL